MILPLLTSCSTKIPSEQPKATLSLEPVITEQPETTLSQLSESRLKDLGYTKEGDFIYGISGGVVIVEYIGNAKELTLPETLGGRTVIGILDTAAFSHNTSLVSVTIPDSYTGGLYETFWGCTSLTTVNIGKGIGGVNMHEHRAFSDCPSLSKISVDQDNPYYSSKDGVMFSKDKTKLLLYPPAKRGKIYSIPKSVVEIGSTAFADCKNLTNITIREGVKTIGAEAFTSCTQLESITIPSSVTRMVEPFYKSPNLTIYCKKDSYAHKYAKKNGLKFSLY